MQTLILTVQANAEVAVREMLQEIARKTKERTGTTTLDSVDYMDDGSPIKLHVTIDEQSVRYRNCFVFFTPFCFSISWSLSFNDKSCNGSKTALS